MVEENLIKNNLLENDNDISYPTLDKTNNYNKESVKNILQIPIERKNKKHFFHAPYSNLESSEESKDDKTKPDNPSINVINKSKSLVDNFFTVFYSLLQLIGSFLLIFAIFDGFFNFEVSEIYLTKVFILFFLTIIGLFFLTDFFQRSTKIINYNSEENRVSFITRYAQEAKIDCYYGPFIMRTCLCGVITVYIDTFYRFQILYISTFSALFLFYVLSFLATTIFKVNTSRTNSIINTSSKDNSDFYLIQSKNSFSKLYTSLLCINAFTSVYYLAIFLIDCIIGSKNINYGQVASCIFIVIFFVIMVWEMFINRQKKSFLNALRIIFLVTIITSFQLRILYNIIDPETRTIVITVIEIISSVISGFFWLLNICYNYHSLHEHYFIEKKKDSLLNKVYDYEHLYYADTYSISFIFCQCITFIILIFYEEFISGNEIMDSIIQYVSWCDGLSDILKGVLLDLNYKNSTFIITTFTMGSTLAIIICILAIVYFILPDRQPSFSSNKLFIIPLILLALLFQTISYLLIFNTYAKSHFEWIGVSENYIEVRFIRRFIKICDVCFFGCLLCFYALSCFGSEVNEKDSKKKTETEEEGKSPIIPIILICIVLIGIAHFVLFTDGYFFSIQPRNLAYKIPYSENFLLPADMTNSTLESSVVSLLNNISSDMTIIKNYTNMSDRYEYFSNFFLKLIFCLPLIISLLFLLIPCVLSMFKSELKDYLNIFSLICFFMCISSIHFVIGFYFVIVHYSYSNVYPLYDVEYTPTFVSIINLSILSIIIPLFYILGGYVTLSDLDRGNERS